MKSNDQAIGESAGLPKFNPEPIYASCWAPKREVKGPDGLLEVSRTNACLQDKAQLE